MMYLFNWLKPKNRNEMIVDMSDIIPDKVEVEVELPKIRVIDIFDSSKPSILIIDDSKGIISIVEDYIAECGINKDSYNILSFYGNFAPFVMVQTLQQLKDKYGFVKVDYAIIDIVLPGKMKVDGKYVKWDGIDVAIYLHGAYNLRNFVFYTGNIINAYVEFIKDKVEKFSSYFNKDMTSHVIFKGESSDELTVKEFCKLLLKEKYAV